MKNIKVDDDTNDFIVRYSKMSGGSKRDFLGKLMGNITASELKRIFGRVWDKTINEEMENKYPVYDDDEEIDIGEEEEGDEELPFEYED